MKVEFFLSFAILLCVANIKGQFPSVCNTAENINSKTCCPNSCGSSSMRGECMNVTEQAIEMWDNSRGDIVSILLNSPTVTEKMSADKRYLWPTVIFEKVCVCVGNFYGFDCNECKFGYSELSNCTSKKPIITRKSFSRLSSDEKDMLVTAYSLLRNEYGRWSVVVDEPSSYNSGFVKLQNASTYDMIIHMHTSSARDEGCKLVNSNLIVDFAHSGPAFPVWHRHYLLFIEREMQRVLNNESFAMPYWSWETNDTEMFTTQYLGVPSSPFNTTVNVISPFFNSTVWPTVCDIFHRDLNVSCEDSWKLCNPANDRNASRSLQRGRVFSFNLVSYFPTVSEVMMAISAPSYDASDSNGEYGNYSPRSSFRNRLEGYGRICSANNCVGPNKESHMHNIVHLWVGGHMGAVPSAVNDPIFILHHSNVDRILESWFRRYSANSSTSYLIPDYIPASGGHPGHNKNDWMVPFFPLVRPIDYYDNSDAFGYEYDEIFKSDIEDSSLTTCDINDTCESCSANGSCINCGNMTEKCVQLISTTPPGVSQDQSTSLLTLGLELGIPLLIMTITVLILTIALASILLKDKIANYRKIGSNQ